MKATMKVLMLTVLATGAISTTASASVWSWRTCYNGENGKIKVRGKVTCDQSGDVVVDAGGHLNRPNPFRFKMRSVGKTWTCFFHPHSTARSEVDCFAGSPANAEVDAWA